MEAAKRNKKWGERVKDCIFSSTSNDTRKEWKIEKARREESNHLRRILKAL